MTPPNRIAGMRARAMPMMWALFLSLLVNLFMVGALIGLVPHEKPHHSFGPMLLSSAHGEYLIDWMAHYLNPSDADAFRKVFDEHSGELKAAHDRIHQALGELSTVFKQDPPDPEALQTALDHLAQARRGMGEIVGTILKVTYVQLSPEGRQRLADLAQNPM